MARLRWVLPALAASLADLAFLPRYFTSEDFLLIRFLREHPPWSDWAATFLEPWLGVTAVGFYRPVATTWFALEAVVFGGDPLPYNLVHLAVHAVNALLVAGIARRIGGRDWEAVAAGVLFAIYPLHPNAVLFLGSFATVFGGFFFLLATWCFVSWLQPRAATRWAFGSVAMFGLALGSYEASVVMPVWAAAGAVLVAARTGAPRWRVWIVVGVLGTVAAGYLAGRHTLFGGLGGYGDLAAVWGMSAWSKVGQSALISLDRLLVPHFAGGSLGLAGVLLRLGGIGALAIVLQRSLGREDRGWSVRVIALSLAWVLAAMAPFSFQPVPPGAGRFWYLAAVPISIAIGLVLGRTGAVRNAARWVAWVALLIVTGVWTALRLEVGQSYREAGVQASRVRQSLYEAVRGEGGTCLVSGVPRFVERHGVPYAQLYHYGLADALGPPFSPSAALPEIFPVLTPPEELGLLAGAPRCRLAWRPLAGRFERVVPGVAPAELAVGFDPVSRRVRLRAAEGIHYSLQVAAPGNSTSVSFEAGARAGTVRAEMPGAFLQTMQRLYGARFAWWVEGRNAAGDLVAVSTYREGTANR